jgi:hypothetical protein
MAKPRSYVRCVANRGHRAALEVRKVCRRLEDAAAEAAGLLRVIDESGESYLQPAQLFVTIDLPRSAVIAFSRQSA